MKRRFTLAILLNLWATQMVATSSFFPDAISTSISSFSSLHASALMSVVPGGGISSPIHTGWGGWANWKGSCLLGPVSTSRKEGLDAFCLSSSSDHIVYRGGHHGFLFAWKSIGGSSAGSPIVHETSEGDLYVAIRGMDNNVHVNERNSLRGIWSGFKIVPGVQTGDVPALASTSSAVFLFARERDGSISLSVRGKHAESWSSWKKSGGSFRSMPVGASVTGASTVATVLAVDTTGILRPGIASIDGTLTWEAGDEEATSPPSVSSRKQAVDVVVRNAEGGVKFASLLSTSGWTGWLDLKGFTNSRPAVASDDKGNIAVFLRGVDKAIWTIGRKPSGVWGYWKSLGGVWMSDPVAHSRGENDEMDVWAIDTSKQLRHATYYN